MYGRSTLWLVLVGIIPVTVGLAPRTAAAQIAGYQVVSAETGVDGASSKQLSVACPTGKKALGAGWGVLDSTGVILNGAATYFAPSWDGSSWLVNAKNLGSSAWKLKVQVQCANASSLPGYEVTTSETAVNTVGSKQVSAVCPSGKSALGAGWGVLDSTGVILHGAASYFAPSWDGSSWLINGRLASGSAAWKLKGLIVCANLTGLPGYELVSQETAVNSFSQKQVSASCPSGKRATGAGWAALDGTGVILDGAATYSLPSWDGSSWLTNLQSAAFSWKGKVQLICATAN